MRKRFLLAAGMIVALGAAPATFAHDDKNGDTSQCDRWWRNNHGTNDTSGHHHTRADEDVNVNDPANQTQIHKHPAQGDPGDVGHYVVRGRQGYLEVVGGGSYQRPVPPGQGAQGGFVEGEIDPTNPVTGAALVPGGDVDFHVSSFAGQNNSGGQGMLPGPAYTEANACVTVGNTTVPLWHNPNKP